MNGDQVDSVEFLDADDTSIYLVITQGMETLLRTMPRIEQGSDEDLYD